MHYLFLSDIDGTLLSHKLSVPQKVYRAAADFTAAGGKLAVCTGRSQMAAQEIALRLGVNAPSILYGGGAIYDYTTERYLMVNSFHADVMIAVHNVLSRCPDVSVQLFALKRVYTLRCNAFLMERGVKEDCIHSPCAAENVDGEILKIVLCSENVLQLQSCKAFFPPEIYNFAFSSRHFVDIVPSGQSKGDSVRQLLQMLGVSSSRLLCAGDSAADIPMLRQAAIRYAPQTAANEVRAMADVLVPSVEDGGMELAFSDAAILQRTLCKRGGI